MITETKEITNSDDYIDVRDVIARVEALESELSEDAETSEDEEERLSFAELLTLRELLEKLEGNGGDEEWRGSWYPIGLVRESYFEDFARQEAEDLDLIKSDARWPYTCIDWERAAEELKQDYSEVDFDGVTYYFR